MHIEEVTTNTESGASNEITRSNRSDWLRTGKMSEANTDEGASEEVGDDESTGEKVPIEISDLTREEREHWLKTGKTPMKDAERPSAEGHESPELTRGNRAEWLRSGKVTEQVNPDDPLPQEISDRVFAGKSSDQDNARYVDEHNRNVEAALKHIESRKEIMDGAIRGMFAGRSDSMALDFLQSIGETRNAGAVLEHIATHPNDRKAILACPNVHALRTTVREISRIVGQQTKAQKVEPKEERPADFRKHLEAQNKKAKDEYFGTRRLRHRR